MTGISAAVAALLVISAGCGSQPATGPHQSRVAITAAIAAAPCAGLRPRPLPLRLTVLIRGHGRQLRVTTDRRGGAEVHLAPGRYTVAPLQPALRRAVTSLRIDGHGVRQRSRHVVDVPAGRHRIVLVIALRPGECNGLGAGV